MITAARERARRRRRLIAASAVAAVATGVAFGTTHVDMPRTRAPSASQASIFADQSPYLGIACQIPNSTGCGRVGVAVWLTHHIDRLTVLVDGKSVELRDTTVGRARARTYIGYVQLARRQLRLSQHWVGNPPRSMHIRLRALAHGKATVRTLQLPLHAGWG